MKKWLLLGAFFFVGSFAAFCNEANAQYGYYPRYYNTYRAPVFYNANDYLRATTYNRNQFYNLGSANAYLRHGTANARYFYGF